jgi:hypothetical protein
MGSLYVSIALRTQSQKDVGRFLSALGRRAYVLPPSKGYVVVCDADCDEQDLGVIASLAQQLSSRFACVAFAVLNHDDDLLWYQLYSSGVLLDKYNSRPDIFSPSAEPHETSGGNASTLCEVFDKPNRRARVERILRSREYLEETERHADLAKALGFPTVHTQLGYSELSRDDNDRPSPDVKIVDRQWLWQFTEPSDLVKPFSLDREIKKLLRQNRKISAIVLCQSHKACSLAEAKRYVESLTKR